MYSLRPPREERYAKLEQVINQVTSNLKASGHGYDNLIPSELQQMIERYEQTIPISYETQYWPESESGMFVMMLEKLDQFPEKLGIDFVEIVRVGYEAALTILETQNQQIQNQSQNQNQNQVQSGYNSNFLSSLLFTKLDDIKIVLIKETLQQLKKAVSSANASTSIEDKKKPPTFLPSIFQSDVLEPLFAHLIEVIQNILAVASNDESSSESNSENPENRSLTYVLSNLPDWVYHLKDEQLKKLHVKPEKNRTASEDGNFQQNVYASKKLIKYLEKMSASIAIGTIWEIDALVCLLFQQVPHTPIFNATAVLDKSTIEQHLDRGITTLTLEYNEIRSEPGEGDYLLRYLNEWGSILERRFKIAKTRILIMLHMHKLFRELFEPVDSSLSQSQEDKSQEDNSKELKKKANALRQARLLALQKIKYDISQTSREYGYGRPNPWKLIKMTVDRKGYQFIDQISQKFMSNRVEFNGHMPYVVILRNGDFLGALFIYKVAPIAITRIGILEEGKTSGSTSRSTSRSEPRTVVTYKIDHYYQSLYLSYLSKDTYVLNQTRETRNLSRHACPFDTDTFQAVGFSNNNNNKKINFQKSKQQQTQQHKSAEEDNKQDNDEGEVEDIKVEGIKEGEKKIIKTQDTSILIMQPFLLCLFAINRILSNKIKVMWDESETEKWRELDRPPILPTLQLYRGEFDFEEFARWIFNYIQDNISSLAKQTNSDVLKDLKDKYSKYQRKLVLTNIENEIDEFTDIFIVLNYSLQNIKFKSFLQH